MSARPRLTRSDYALVEAALAGARNSGSGNARVGCPLCERIRGKRDTKQSLYLHADGGWVCFRCAAAGWLPGTGSNRGLRPRRPETEILDPSADSEAWKRPPEGFYELYAGEGEDAVAFNLHRQYIEARGIDPRTAKLAHLGGCITGRLAWHVVLPILGTTTGVYDPDGPMSWQGWVARTLYPPEDPFTPIYREPYGAPKGRSLYRGDILASASSSPAYVVEGVFDALPLWPDAVATLGKVTQAHLDLLAQSKRPVVFIPDGDAWRAGDAYALYLRILGVRAGCLRLPPRVDPDEIRADILRELAEYSLDALDAVRVEL